MSEAGGPVFEGSSVRKEVQSKDIVEHMKSNWKKNTEKNAQEILEKAQKRMEFKALGKTVEQRYVDAFDKVIGAMDEGKLKQVANMVRPIVKLEAKVVRVGTAVVDTVVAAVPGVLGFSLYQRGVSGLVSEISGGAKYSAGQVIGALGVGGVGMAIGSGIIWLSPARRTSMWVIEKGGNIGERVAKWSNKILSGGQKVEMPAPQAAT